MTSESITVPACRPCPRLVHQFGKLDLAAASPWISMPATTTSGSSYSTSDIHILFGTGPMDPREPKLDASLAQFLMLTSACRPVRDERQRADIAATAVDDGQHDAFCQAWRCFRSAILPRSDRQRNSMSFTPCFNSSKTATPRLSSARPYCVGSTPCGLRSRSGTPERMLHVGNRPRNGGLGNRQPRSPPSPCCRLPPPQAEYSESRSLSRRPTRWSQCMAWPYNVRVIALSEYRITRLYPSIHGRSTDCRQ